ncbi:DUF3006 domain-containing protein [Bacillus sp. JJ1532]|uniref:DUF3006 domain-containing protein n=1 Tax=unclassified Bacillus (in: firmicutes) TaxID=185979 RepID=UPI002FFE6E21
MIQYTLDRFEESFGVLLKYPNEEEQLLVPKKELEEFREGDILSVTKNDDQYSISLLNDETEKMRSKVNDLINKLKNK